MGESVQILERQFGHFPAKFKLTQGDQLLEVEAVERCWTEMPRRPGVARYHFRVRCGSQFYRLSEDTGSGEWSVQLEKG